MIDVSEAEPVPVANAAGSFAVMSREKIFSWGITYRLRLIRDVHVVEERLGYDALLKMPAVQRRSFARPAGWETDVTLIGRELRPGDRVDAGEIIPVARLWSEWR